MNKKALFLFLISFGTGFVFVNTVEPDIEKPISILAFYTVCFLNGTLLAYMTLYGVKQRVHRISFSLLSSFLLVYCLSLLSLRQFRFTNILIPLVIVALVVWVAKKLSE